MDPPGRTSPHRSAVEFKFLTETPNHPSAAIHTMPGPQPIGWQ